MQSSPGQLQKDMKNMQLHEQQLHTRNIHTQSPLGQLCEDVNEDDNILHTHAKMDNDSVEFWDQVLSFLINLKLPSDPDKAWRVKNHAKAFFYLRIFYGKEMERNLHYK
jgi:hypothetical protein